VEPAYLFGIVGGVLGVVVGVALFVVATETGDFGGQILGVTWIVVGPLLVIRNVLAERHANADHAASIRWMREQDANISSAASLTTSLRSQPSRPTMVKCPFCGTFEHMVGARFCHQCGKPLPHAPFVSTKLADGP